MATAAAARTATIGAAAAAMGDAGMANFLWFLSAVDTKLYTAGLFAA